MIQKIVSALMNWIVAYVIIPLSLIVIDYFHMKKTNKDLKEKVKALESAKTSKEKDEAIDNLP